MKKQDKSKNKVAEDILSPMSVGNRCTFLNLFSTLKNEDLGGRNVSLTRVFHMMFK